MPTWEKGQSGNQAGSKKTPELRLLKNACIELYSECLEGLKELMKSDNEKIKLQAINSILDRGFGKPEQAVSAEVTGKDGGPLTAVINWGKRPDAQE